jgi:Rrf2 family cysteine metabolism transcriptional repressor
VTAPDHLLAAPLATRFVRARIGIARPLLRNCLLTTDYKPPPVKVSAKTEYACIAMLELAASYGTGEPVRIKSIAQQHDIPSRFLVQILLQLKGAGLVTSTRGASGGYQLLKPPEEISLGAVMSVIEGPPESAFTGSASPDSPAARALAETWREIAAVERRMLDSVSIADLLDRARRQNENMYYI